MPPKKLTKSSQNRQDIESGSDYEISSMASASPGLEDFLDRRLKQQSEHIDDLFMKYSKMTKSDFEEIKQSQGFLNSKFEDLINSVNELKSENKVLRKENAQLHERVGSLEGKVASAESDMENLKQYLRRDLVEIHGVPVTENEDTNSIVKQIVHLLDSTMNLEEHDISISHRLPASAGYIPPIIVKFVRRDVRNKIFNLKRNLSSKSACDLGFHQESKLYINESLTQKSRALLKEVKSFKKHNHFKFVWSKQGKILLRKDDNQSSRVFTFTTLEEFESFKANYQQGQQHQDD